jgi:hypothetical protein
MKYFALGLMLVSMRFVSSGQSMNFKEVNRLPETVNSKYEETLPVLSTDGKTLYFSRVMDPENVQGVYSGSDIWVSQRDPQSGSWGNSSNKAIGLNTRFNNAVVGTSKDGNLLYLLDTWGIYFSKRSANGWERPEKVHIPDFRAEGFLGVFVAPDYDVILLSMNANGSHGEEDLYVSLKDGLGNWSVPKNLGPTINTKGFEISPFLSQDKRRLYFASNGHPGSGDADIFYSDRLHESWELWSSPTNLGAKINSASFDAYFSIYGDSLAFFASNRDGGMADLYQVHVTLSEHSDELTKRYLTEEDTRALIGGASQELKFNQNATELNTAQNELLFYIVNKIITRSDIKMHLMIREGAKDLSRTRMDVVSEKLKLLGISGYRISASIIKQNEESELVEDIIYIRLFR